MQQIHSSHSLPCNQVNAHLSETLEVRVGIPQKAGKLAFHAFNEGYKAMVSANAFWNSKTAQFSVPTYSDLYDIPFALDSAGFVAHHLFKLKGKQAGIAGVYPWTYGQYIALAADVCPDWWSQPDMCCEAEIATNQEEIDYRINATATLLEGTLRVLYAWQDKMAMNHSATEICNLLKPPVPIIQGRTADDYLRSLDMLLQVWQRWEPWLAPPRLIGLGSVCRRSTDHPEDGLYTILQKLDGRLPEGMAVHLFGVKGTALNEVMKLSWVNSTDSMAFDYGARVKARKAGCPNTHQHRSSEMSLWMSKAESRITLPQLGLNF